MEFYTLNYHTFNREVLIDDFESAIWTERFIEAGDAKLVVPATHEMVKLLKPGALLSLQESQEIVLLDTREIQDGMMTVSGKTLESFLQYRWVQPGIFKDARPTVILHWLVSDGISSVHTFYYSWIDNYNSRSYPGEEDEPLINKKYKRGPAYPVMLEIANKHQIGMAFKRTLSDEPNQDSNFPSYHELLFVTRYGQDRSRTQEPGTFNNIVRFSPDLENLENVKELRSDVDFINFVYVSPPTRKKFPDLPTDTANDRGMPGGMSIHNPNDGNLVTTMPNSNPFERRFAEVYMDDVVTAQEIADQTNGYEDGPLWPAGCGTVVRKMMYDEAYKIFAEHKRTKMVEGEVVPGTQFEYKRDYDLGDLVDIDGDYGSPIKARVMEYVRSQDATGERAYPTISAAPDATKTQYAGGDF